MTDTHTGKLLSEIKDPAKARKKKADTIWGAALALFGVPATLSSFALTIRVVWTGGTIEKWNVILFGGFFVGGLVMVVIGAHRASREVMSAVLKDIGSFVGSVWKRDG